MKDRSEPASQRRGSAGERWSSSRSSAATWSTSDAGMMEPGKRRGERGRGSWDHALVGRAAGREAGRAVEVNWGLAAWLGPHVSEGLTCLRVPACA